MLNVTFLHTVLPHVHTNRGVGRRAGGHGCTRGPNVVKQENWDRGKPENSEPSNSKNVREEHKLKQRHEKHLNIKRS